MGGLMGDLMGDLIGDLIGDLMGISRVQSYTNFYTDYYMNSFLQSFFGTSNNDSNEKSLQREPTFKLPIQYLNSDDLHPLQPTVVNDLELVPSTDESNKTYLYDNLFQPKHEFAKKMIPNWQHYITTNTDFLKESQEVIQSLDIYEDSINQIEYDLSCSQLKEVWSDVKEDPYFLERYSYMEIEMLQHANTIPAFLQAITVINMSSPILSFFIPFVMFLMPFIIIKIQGHPITFDIYLSVLKDISRHHFIGKIISNAGDFSPQSVVYLLGIVGLYIYQIYQNWISCSRFYKNIEKINQNISTIKHYLDYSIQSMETFAGIIANKSTYQHFLTCLQKKIENLHKLRQLFSSVQPFSPSFSKIGEIGNLLSCYYQLHSNIEYGEALKYSFEFEGYINNLLGVHENLVRGRIGMATYDPSTNLVIKDQYYPPLLEGTDGFKTNDADIQKNMIITGPNAAGKTTYLKTTTLNIIYSQQIGCGFYSSCLICPYTHIHSYLNIPDTSGRDSLFQAESRRCKEIIATILQNQEKRHFCIFDELYSGTNPLEATKSAYAFLTYLAKFENVDFILTTHYLDMCDRFSAEKSELIENWKMDVDILENGDLDYQYTISLGISKVQGAIKVLRDMEYPSEILDTIQSYDIKKDGKKKHVKKSIMIE